MEDAAAVVVEQHNRHGRAAAFDRQQAVHVMIERDIAEDRHQRCPFARRADAQGCRGVAVDARGAAIGPGERRPRRRDAELVEMADGQAVAGEEGGIGRDKLGKVAQDGAVEVGAGRGFTPDDFYCRCIRAQQPVAPGGRLGGRKVLPVISRDGGGRDSQMAREAVRIVSPLAGAAAIDVVGQGRLRQEILHCFAERRRAKAYKDLNLRELSIRRRQETLVGIDCRG